MITLNAQRRNPAAMKPRAMRRQGLLPMALTRRDHTTIEIQAPIAEVRNAARGADEHGRFELLLPDEAPCKVIIKQQEIDYLHQHPLHMTLQEVADEDVVRLDVPIVAVGTPEAVGMNTGMLVQPTDHVKLRGRMADLPEHLEVDVSHLQVGEAIYASELQLPAGIELMSSADATLMTLQVAKTMEEPAEQPVMEEETAGPEGSAYVS